MPAHRDPFLARGPDAHADAGALEKRAMHPGALGVDAPSRARVVVVARDGLRLGLGVRE